MSLSQLSRLLPLPEADLQQVLDYASTLSKQEAITHFSDLLGESPQSVEFISSFNARRQAPTPAKTSQPATRAAESDGVPRTQRKAPKKKPPLHTPAPRQIQDTYAAQGTAYKKQSEDDYIPKRPVSNNAFALDPKPAAIQAPIPKAPPSASGSLISDFKTKSSSSSRNASQNPSRTSSPLPPAKQKNTKISITGGQSMHAPSTTLSALDSAIRTLEISTNSSLLSEADNLKRKCNCIGARHPLLAAAPNCLNCGKVICVKEGLGPCTFCGSPLLSATEVQGMIHELREERGREKMAYDASTQRKVEVSKAPAPFSTPKEVAMSPAEAKAKDHRDRLLGFQAQNAKRTTVHDEAADFDIPTAGTSMWASPAERARQLKMQQKVLAEREWNARPEWEKRRQVVSIDLVKGKAIKRMAAVERPKFEVVESDGEEEEVVQEVSGNGGGSFSRNPLLGMGLIRPVWTPREGEGEEVEEEQPKRKTWRRVQDDLDDNEGIILDGGAFGETSREEPACG